MPLTASAFELLESFIERLLAWSERSGRRLIGPCLLILVALGLCQMGVVRIPVAERIEPARVAPDGGHAYVYRMPTLRPEGAGRPSGLELREDGRALGPGKAHPERVRTLGGGRFARLDRAIQFSSSDGTDPRRNAREYSVRYDWMPGRTIWMGAVAAAALVAAGPALRALRWLDTANPAWPSLALVALALGYRTLVLAFHGQETVEGALIKGAPFSDARGWDTLATEFAHGERWDSSWTSWGARRPLYYLFMGSVFALTRPSPLTAQVTHLLLGAVGTVLVFDAVRRVAGARIALLTATVQATQLSDALHSLTTLSEPLGTFLTNLSIWALIIAMRRPGEGENASRLGSFASGVTLALANLARPLNLPAVAVLPVVWLWIAWRRRGFRSAWRMAAPSAACFIAGFAIALTPWIVRQRVVYGITTLSDNSAEMLYAATTPEFGSWTPEVAALAGSRTIRERVQFYEAGFRRHLSEHTGWYAKHVARSTLAAGRDIRLHWLPLLSAALLGAASAWAGAAPGSAARGRAVIVGGLVAVGVLLCPGDRLHWLWIGAMLLAILRGEPIAILGGLLAPTLAAMGVVAYRGLRFTYSLEWMAAALAFWAIFRLSSLGTTGASEPRQELPLVPSWGRARAPIVAGAIVAVVLLLVGAARATLANLKNPDRAPPQVRVTGTDAVRCVATALEGDSGSAYAGLRDRMEVRRARLRAGYVMRFDAEEAIEHWCALFEPRAYAFSVFETRPPVGELHAVFPDRLDELPAGGDLTLVGVPVPRPRGGGSLEVVAIGHAGRWIRPSPAEAAAHAADIARDLGAPR